MLYKPDQEAINPFKSGEKRNSISYNANPSYSARNTSNRRI